MKKFLFSALACVAFAGSSFATNSADLTVTNTNEIYVVSQTNFIKNDKSFFICSLIFNVYNRDGELVHQMAASPNVNGSGCLGEAIKLYRELEGAFPDHVINYSIVNS